MQLKTSVHTHTTFCDGRDTPAAMAAAVSGLSPVIMTVLMPIVRKSAKFSLMPCLTMSFR